MARRPFRVGVRHRSFWLLAAFALALPYPQPASAQPSGPFCGAAITENCIIENSITVNGAPKTTNITALLTAGGGVYAIRLLNTNNPADPFELVSAVDGLTTASQVSLTFRMSNAATDPRSAVSTGLIASWTVNTVPNPNEVTITANPRASSWARATPSPGVEDEPPGGCVPAFCETTADVDYQALLLAAFDPMTPPSPSPELVNFLNKYTTGYMSTNAQYFSPLPNYNAATDAISFFVGSPHFKLEAGPVVSTGFVRMFIPEGVITDPTLWNIAGGSAALAATNSMTTVTVGGSPADFDIDAVTDGGIALGALVKVGEAIPFSFSVPEVVVKPTAATGAPTLTQISPTSGTTSGATAVTLTGTGFNGSSVRFDGILATSVTVVNATTITGRTPAHAAGTVSVVVTNGGGQSATLASSYTYVAYPAFTDGTLIAGSSVILAVHITELRTRIDGIRVARGLSAVMWTDPTLSQGSTFIRAVHLTELRTALAQAYAAAGLPPPSYADPTLDGSIHIKVVHIAELRAAVTAIE